MAFNWHTFRTRALTAAIFVAVMLTGLLWNQWSFLILFSIIHFGCWWEYLKLIEKIHKTIFHTYTKLGFMLLGYGFMLWFCDSSYHIYNYGLKENFSLPVSATGFGLLIIGMFQREIKLSSFAANAVGLVYISLSWGLMMNLKEVGASISCMNGGSIGGANTIYNHFIFPLVIVPLTIIISLWINDTMAYIVGSLIGKTPLTKISPKKTWEGTTGGIILSVIATGLIFSNLNPEIVIRDFRYDFPNNSIWYIIAAIASVSGTFGDLFESKLKRMADVKDSGHIMPGHGGFLDRFDSLLFATPCVWLLLYLLQFAY